MQDDNKNFRSHYYERVGFRGVDERKTVDALLSEDPVSRTRCEAFALKCAVPADRRRKLWSSILGISASYPRNEAYVERWRKQPFLEARESLATMHKVDDSRPAAQNLTVIFLLFSRRLKFDVEKQLQERMAQDFMAIAESTLAISDSDEITAFWIAKQLYHKINSHPEGVMSKLVRMGREHLTNGVSSNNLYGHLDKIGVIQELPFSKWFSRAFAGVLCTSALERVWDKVVGGSLVVLVHVAIALVDRSKTALLGCQTPGEAIRCLSSTSVEADEQIVQVAMDNWTREGQPLLPPVAATAASASEKHHQHHHQHQHQQQSQPRRPSPVLATKIVVREDL